MPAVARLNDPFKTGHPSVPVSKITKPSTDVFANNLGVERRGDPSVLHQVGRGTHIVNITGGSSTVFVNNKPIARVGDSIDKGAISSGSPNVFAGG